MSSFIIFISFLIQGKRVEDLRKKRSRDRGKKKGGERRRGEGVAPYP